MISIIVPAFNSAQTIAACLDSLLEQTFAEKEIIVVDGLSSDRTPAILANYAARFPALSYLSEKDKGIYDAINKGIRLSKGEWIFILGSDDRLFENSTLQKANEYLSAAKEGVVYGNVQIKGDAGWAKDGEIYGGEFSLEKLLERNICQQAVFYRRSLFEQIGYFNVAYSVCADWDFILHAAARSTMKYMPLTIAEFNGGGTSAVVKEEKFYEELPANLYRYFGLRVFRKEFRVAGWRFEKLAQQNAKQGRRARSFFYKLLAKKHK